MQLRNCIIGLPGIVVTRENLVEREAVSTGVSYGNWIGQDANLRPAAHTRSTAMVVYLSAVGPIATQQLSNRRPVSIQDELNESGAVL